jgi:predicted lipoprotein with Yx(FWY)xxD motif
VLAACGDDDSTKASTAAQTEPTTSATAPATVPPALRGPVLKLRDSQLGPVLFSGTDRALYTFTRDRSGDEPRSRCYGDCADAWPPFLAKKKPPRGGRGVNSEFVGTIPRGRHRQITYAGQPLDF